MVVNPQTAPPHWWNVPNQLTALRLVLAIVVFGLVPFGLYSAALVVFLVAVSTDWIDGYWARKYGQVTKLGRILDPFVDKFIICGSFIHLAAIPDSAIHPWVAVLVTARELLVTALRGLAEGQGVDFSARWSGKWKMVFQCLAASLALFVLARDGSVPSWVLWSRFAAIGLAVLATIHSGLEYTLSAITVLRGGKSGGPS